MIGIVFDGLLILFNHTQQSLNYVISFVIHNWQIITSSIMNATDIVYLIIIESIIAAYEISKVTLVNFATLFIRLLMNNPASIVYGIIILIYIILLKLLKPIPRLEYLRPFKRYLLKH